MDDVEKLYKMIEGNFPDMNIGDQADLIIRSWLHYLSWHMKENPCDDFKKIVSIRVKHIMEIMHDGDPK